METLNCFLSMAFVFDHYKDVTDFKNKCGAPATILRAFCGSLIGQRECDVRAA
jgi:hypothetical protein